MGLVDSTTQMAQSVLGDGRHLPVDHLRERQHLSLEQAENPKNAENRGENVTKTSRHCVSAW
jgi:hypothetical protein